MKHKTLAAPLLSLTLLILFYQPIKNGDLIKQPNSPLKNQILVPTKAALSPATDDQYAVSRAMKMGQNHSSLLNQQPEVTARPSAPPAVAQTGNLDVQVAVVPHVETIDPDLRDFITLVSGGQEGADLKGVHIKDVLALKVEQQPKDNAAFVSTELGTATQFSSAARNGVTGLLAHNYLSGQLFYQITLGQEVHLVYRDGSIKSYKVTDIESFQKLTPSSLHSDLIDLGTGRKFSTAQVFKRFYAGGDHVTFQTCLAKDGISNWGLTFFIATPIQ